ncbi:MAG: DUF3631 domain-containing protein [Longimicrobiales bacterium]
MLQSVRRLGSLAKGADAVTREALRAGAFRFLRRLNWRLSLLDQVLGLDEADDARDSAQGQAIALSDLEPWPSAVGGAELLDELAETFTRHLSQPEGAATAEALWTVHTYAHDAAMVSPILALTSPSKRCGKTTALTLLSGLVARPILGSNITPAALFRAVEKYRPTLLVDEADTFLPGRDELRGILNSGHARAAAIVVRTVGDDHEARTFSTWAPKAVAMIGELPDTLRDRSIAVRLQRRRRDEKVTPLRLDKLGEFEALRRQCTRWAADHLKELRSAEPTVPEALHDRARDNWRPLLAIAEAAGGAWPERARCAALLLSGSNDDEGDAVVALLADMRTAMSDRACIASTDLVKLLVGLGPGHPWGEYRKGAAVSERQVAALLRRVEVRPRQHWYDGRKIRGYARNELGDAWNRYLPATGASDAVGPVGLSNGAGDQRPFGSVGGQPPPESRSTHEPNDGAHLPSLPDQTSDPAWEYTEALEREAIQREEVDP